MKKLTEGNILKLIIQFTMPVLLGTHSRILYTCDIMMVGRFIDTESLAGGGS